MALKFGTGFHQNSLTNGVEFDTITGSPTITDMPGGYSGQKALRTNPTAATAYVTHRFKTPNSTVSWIQWKFRIATAPAALIRIFNGHDTNWPIDRIGIRLNSNRTLELWDEDAGAQIGSDSSALDLDTEYVIAVKHDDANSTATAYINGVIFASGSFGGSAEEFSRFDLGVYSSATCDLYFSDVLVGDGVAGGVFDTPLFGSYRTKTLRPNAAGDNNPTAGDYTAIDETTPNDATDFIELDVDNTTIGDFNLEASGMTTEQIKAVLVGARHRAETAAAMSYKLRFKTQASGTLSESGTITHDDTTWRTNGDTTFYGYQLAVYTDPQAGGALTGALLDTSQIGVAAVDATPDIHVTAMWAFVVYRPTAAKLNRIVTTESLGASGRSSSSPSNKVLHTVYQPSGDSHIIFFSLDATVDNVATRPKADFYVDGVLVGTYSPRFNNLNEQHAFFFFHKVTGKTIDFDCEIRISSTDNSNSSTFKNARIISWRYSDWQGLDLQYAEGNASSTGLTAAFVDGASAAFTPSSTGNYFVLSCLGIAPGSTSVSAIAAMSVDGTLYPFNSGTDEHWTREAAAAVTDAFHCFASGIRQSLAGGGSRTVKVQAKNESGTTGQWQYSRILTFREDAFASSNYAEADTAAVDTNNTTTYETRGTVTTTAPSAAQDYLIIAGISHGVEVVSSTQAERSEADIQIDASEVAQSEMLKKEPTTPVDYLTLGAAIHKNTGSAFTVITAHRMQNWTDDTGGAKSSWIIIIRGDLPSAAMMSPLNEQMPFYIKNELIGYRP